MPSRAVGGVFLPIVALVNLCAVTVGTGIHPGEDGSPGDSRADSCDPIFRPGTPLASLHGGDMLRAAIPGGANGSLAPAWEVASMFPATLIMGLGLEIYLGRPTARAPPHDARDGDALEFFDTHEARSAHLRDAWDRERFRLEGNVAVDPDAAAATASDRWRRVDVSVAVKPRCFADLARALSAAADPGSARGSQVDEPGVAALLHLGRILAEGRRRGFAVSQAWLEFDLPEGGNRGHARNGTGHRRGAPLGVPAVQISTPEDVDTAVVAEAIGNLNAGPTDTGVWQDPAYENWLLACADVLHVLRSIGGSVVYVGTWPSRSAMAARVDVRPPMPRRSGHRPGQNVLYTLRSIGYKYAGRPRLGQVLESLAALCDDILVAVDIIGNVGIDDRVGFECFVDRNDTLASHHRRDDDGDLDADADGATRSAPKPSRARIRDVLRFAYREGMVSASEAVSLDAHILPASCDAARPGAGRCPSERATSSPVNVDGPAQILNYTRYVSHIKFVFQPEKEPAGPLDPQSAPSRTDPWSAKAYMWVRPSGLF